jgi:hypothetical protein
MKGSNQTKLTELLKAGAAIASGTVTEPYALQFKFPLPTIHAFYAEGLSALEAYYLSLANPYQLLIVGDPLCQPFARPPQVDVSGGLGEADGEPAVVMQLKQSAAETSAKEATPWRNVEIFLDGKLVNRDQPRERYRMKIGALPGGAYELRVVAIGEPRLAPRKLIRTWFTAPGLLPTPTATRMTTNAELPPGSRITLKLEATGADSIRLQHFEETVATLDGDGGEVRVDLEPLGEGPVRLRPIATFRGTEVPGREFVVEHDRSPAAEP